MSDKGKQPARDPPWPETPNDRAQHQDEQSPEQDEDEQPAQQDEQQPPGAETSDQTNDSRDDPPPSTPHAADTTLNQHTLNSQEQSLATPLPSPTAHQLGPVSPASPQRRRFSHRHLTMPSIIRQSGRHIFSNPLPSLTRSVMHIPAFLRERHRRFPEREPLLDGSTPDSNPLGTHHPLNTQIDGSVQGLMFQVTSPDREHTTESPTQRRQTVSDVEEQLNQRSRVSILEEYLEAVAMRRDQLSPESAATRSRSASFTTLEMLQMDQQRRDGTSTIRESNDALPTSDPDSETGSLPQVERDAAFAPDQVRLASQTRPQRRVEDIEEGEAGPSSNLAPLPDPRLFELTDEDEAAMETTINNSHSDAVRIANQHYRRIEPHLALERHLAPTDQPQLPERSPPPRPQTPRFGRSPSPLPVSHHDMRPIEHGGIDQHVERLSPIPSLLPVPYYDLEQTDHDNDDQRVERPLSPTSVPQRTIDPNEHNDDDPTHWRFMEGSSRNQSWVDYWPGELHRTSNVSYPRILSDDNLQRELLETIDRAPGPHQTRQETIDEADSDIEHEYVGPLQGPTPRPSVQLPQSPYQGADTSNAQDSRAGTPQLNVPGQAADSESESDFVAREVRRGPQPRTLFSPSPMPSNAASRDPVSPSQSPFIPRAIELGDTPVRPRARTPPPPVSPPLSTASDDSDGLLMAPSARQLRRGRSRERLNMVLDAARTRARTREQVLQEVEWNAPSGVDQSDEAVSPTNTGPPRMQGMLEDDDTTSPAPTDLSTAETFNNRDNVVPELAARVEPGWPRSHEARYRALLLLLRRYSQMGERDAQLAIGQWEHEIMQQDFRTPVHPVDYLQHPIRPVAVARLSQMLFGTLQRIESDRPWRGTYLLRSRDYDVHAELPEIRDRTLYRSRQPAVAAARRRSWAHAGDYGIYEMTLQDRQAFQDIYHQQMADAYHEALQDREHFDGLDTVRSWYYSGDHHGEAQLDIQPGNNDVPVPPRSTFRWLLALRPLYGAGEWFRQRDRTRIEQTRDRIPFERAPGQADPVSHPPVPTSLLVTTVGDQIVQDMRERYGRDIPMPINGFHYDFEFFEILRTVVWVHRNILMHHNRRGLVPDLPQVQRAIARRIHAWQGVQRLEFERMIGTPGSLLMMPGPRDVIELVQMRQEEFYRLVPLDAPMLPASRLTRRASLSDRLQENRECQLQREGSGGSIRLEREALERPVTPPPRRSNTLPVPSSLPHLPSGPPAPLPPSVSRFLDRVEASRRPLVNIPVYYPTGFQLPSAWSSGFPLRLPGEFQAPQRDGSPFESSEHEGYEEMAASCRLFETHAAYRQRRADDRVVAGPSRPRVVLPRTLHDPAAFRFQTLQRDGSPYDSYEDEGYEELAAAPCSPPEAQAARRQRRAHERVVAGPSQPRVVLPSNSSAFRSELESVPASDPPHSHQPTNGYFDQPLQTNGHAQLAEQSEALENIDEDQLNEEIAAATELDPEGRFDYLRRLATERPPAVVLAAARTLDHDNRLDLLQLLTRERVDAGYAPTFPTPIQSPALPLDQTSGTDVSHWQAQQLMAGASHNQAAWPPQAGAVMDAGAQEERRDTIGGPVPSANVEEPKTNGYAHDDEDLDVEDDVPKAPVPP